MATKVGEGYIEIRPRLVNFNRDLLRDARRLVKDLEDRSKETLTTLSVRPKITGITKAWQAEVQKELNSKITGLTVDVKVRLENRALKATFNEFTVEAKRSGKAASDGLNEGFKDFVGNLNREMQKANIAIKSGLKPASDPEIKKSTEDLGLAFQDLAEDIEEYSRDEVRSINTAVNSFKSLHTAVGRDSAKAAKEFEDSVRRVIREADTLSERIRNNRLDDGPGNVVQSAWAVSRILERELQEANKIADQLFPDLEDRVKQHGERIGKTLSSTFGRVFRANLFDNIAEGVLTLIARFTLLLVAAPALLTAFSNLAGGLVVLGSLVVDLYGAFAALPAVWAATTQAAGVLTIALFGVEQAITALQNEEQHAARNADIHARQIAAAQENIADAKERLKRVIESANERIEASEESLAEVKTAAARRIAEADEAVAEARERVAESIEAANERIADAQADLGRAYSSAADRIASAEDRHRSAIERVRDAQEDLNRAYEDALERFEDLNIALGNSILDEEGARLAIERAKQRLDEVVADPNATDLDKREADLAYREALQRLQEIQEKNADLRKEIEEANREGVEGSDEVTTAKERLLDAQRAEIEAQQEIAKAHRDAAEIIRQAQERLADAQADAVRAQIDGAERIREAEEDAAQARQDAAKSVQKAQEDLAKTQRDSARDIADANKAVKRSIDDLTQAQKDQTAQWYNARFAMEQLSPEAQRFVQFLVDEFIPKLKLVQWAVQDAFFPPIQRALEKSDPLLNLFQVKLNQTAEIFGNLIGKTIEWLNQPETINSLGRIMDNNNELFKLLGDAALNFGDALLIVAEEAGPFVKDMGQLVLDFSEWIKEIVSSESGRQELRDFFDNVGRTIKTAYDIVKLLAPAFWEIYQIARPFAEDILNDLKDIAEEFSEWVDSPQGQTEIEKFLKNGTDFLRELIKLIEDVGKGFFNLGKDGNFSDVLESLRKDLLPAIENIIDALGGGSDGGGFVFLIKATSLALNTLAGTISIVAAAFSLITGDFDGARDSLADFLETARNNAEVILGDRLPATFGETAKSYEDAIRGMQDSNSRFTDDLNRVQGDAHVWTETLETTTNLAETNFDEMATNTGSSLGRFRDDVDGKTKDAKTKAEQNTKETREAVIAQAEEMRIQSEKKMEEYRKMVDQKTLDAKNDSNRNVGAIVSDATTLLVPFSSAFRTAGEEAQKAIQTPGANWTDVGKAVIEGFLKGIRDMIPNLLQSIYNLGADILKWINDALGNQSPSKKAAIAGEFFGKGLANGIESTSERVARATRKLSNTMMTNLTIPAIEAEVGFTGRKAVPTLQGSASNVSAGPRNVNYITVNAAPTVPTEKQISNVLKYQEALYGDD